MAPLERLAADGLRQGRPAWVRSLIAMLPPSARTLRLDIFEAMAVQALNVNDGQSASEQALLDLMSRAAADPTASTLQVAALLANHYRMMGDARLLAVCQGLVGDALDVACPEDELAGRWSPERCRRPPRCSGSWVRSCCSPQTQHQSNGVDGSSPRRSASSTASDGRRPPRAPG